MGLFNQADAVLIDLDYSYFHRGESWCFLKFQFWLPDNVGFDKSLTFVLIFPKNVYKLFLTHSRKFEKNST